MKKVNVFLIVLSAVSTSLLILLLLMRLAAPYVEDGQDGDINAYFELSRQEDFLPTLAELGVMEEMSYRHYYDNYAFFRHDSYLLRVKYDKDAFPAALDALYRRYTFSDEPVIDEFTGKKQRTFTLDGFDFTLLPDSNGEELEYTKKMLFIGVNESTREIAYVYFYDPDLDMIEGGLDGFLIHDCQWS